MSLPESPAPPGLPEAPAPPRAGSSAAARVVFVLVCAAIGAVLAVPAAWLWTVVADAPKGVVFEGQVFYDEVQLNVQSEVTLWFIVVGVVLGILAGLAVGLRGERHGVVTVVAVLALCAVASLVTGWLGVHVFGPDEAAQVAEVEEGGEISGAFSVDTWVAYLGWPVGGMIGALAAIAGWPKEPATSELIRPDAPSSPDGSDG